RTALQQFGEPADRGERSAELVGHVGKETSLDLIGLLQRHVPLAQCLLSLLRIGDVEHRQQPVAVGQGNAGKLERSSVRELDAPALLLAIERRGPDYLADRLLLAGLREIRRDRLKQLVGGRMRVHQVRIETPAPGKAAVPELQMPIRRENSER